MKEKLDISIIIPARDEDESVGELSQWIIRVMNTMQQSYEVLYIDDGSTDDTWSEITKVSKMNPAFKAIRFSRNYGKTAALQTGFRASQGKVVITMDADMQDSPDEIPELYNMIVEKKYHLVSGWKKKRHDPLFKKISSRFFNLVTRKISGIHLHDFNCGLKAYQATVVKHINLYGEMHRYIPLLAKWAGFSRIEEKEVKHYKRKYGLTKFGWDRFIKGFLDLASVIFVVKFTRNPMHFFGSLGTLSFLLGLILTVRIFYQKIKLLFIYNTGIEREVVNQPIFYLALAAIVIGVQLFLTGYLAEMIAMQTASKCDYIIIDKLGFHKKR